MQQGMADRALSARQIRDARAALGWSRVKLARRAGISDTTLRRAEAEPGDHPLTPSSLAAIARALHLAGIVFAEDGVRLERLR